MAEPGDPRKPLQEAQGRLLRTTRAQPPPDVLPPQEIERLRAAWRAPAQVRLALRRAGVPPRYREGLGVEEDLVPAGAKVLLHTWRDGGCLLLAGPPGTGKTTTLAWLAAQLHLAGDVVEGPGGHPLWGSPVVRLFKVRDLYASVFARRTTPLAEARVAEVLLLDDWGAAYEHEWPLAELDGLVDHRWDRQLPTVVTTNLAPTREQGGTYSFEATSERAYSRLTAAPGPGLVLLDRKDLRR